MLLLHASVLAGCSGSNHAQPPNPPTVAAPASEPATPPAAPGEPIEGDAPISAYAPFPFSVGQIRAATRNGRSYEVRQQSGEVAYAMRMVFSAVDAEGATVTVVMLEPDGSSKGGPPPKRVTWAELHSHARFPADATTITVETITVPAGSFACQRYDVQEGVGGVLNKYWFAKELPGMPVKSEAWYMGERTSHSELQKHTPGK